MAYALVARGKVTGVADNNTATSASLATTGATLLIVIASNYDIDPTVTDSIDGVNYTGNTWTSLTSYEAVAHDKVKIAYVVGTPNVSATHTFRINNGGANYPSVEVLAFSATGTTALDAGKDTGAVTEGAASLATGSLTPSEDNCVVIAGATWATNNTPTINGGFDATNTTSDYISGRMGGGGAYLIQTTATAANPTWSWSGSNAAAVCLAVFKGGGAGGGGAAVFGPLLGGKCFSLVQQG